MSTVNNQKLSQTQSPHREDEFDLRELFSILWKGKWIIIGVTFIFAIASVGYALYLPNEYKATTVLQSNDNSQNKLSSMASQFGGLASLAGINLGSGESSDSMIAVEILGSWGFAEKFINKHNLALPLFATKGWAASSNQIIIDEDIYSTTEQAWVRKPPKGKTVEPTSWELYKEFKDRLSINQDKETGLISISITFYSPEIAKEWVDLLVKDINQLMRQRALQEANNNIAYLEEQFASTPYAELRTMFSELIQEQHKNKMLAQASDEYTFKTVSAAKVPEEKEKPHRGLIVIAGFLLGGLLSSVVLILITILRRK